MSCVINGTVSATYHGFSHWPWHDVALRESTPWLGDREADAPAQVVVTVQVKQARQQAPLVRAVLGCGVGEAGERRADVVRLAMARGTLVSLVGEAITYCARSNTLNVRGLAFVNTSPISGFPMHFVNLRPTTPEPTTP
jgi:hypothetical protein